MQIDEETRAHPPGPGQVDDPAPSGAATLAALERLEKVAREIRGLLDARQRENWRRDLTVWRLLAIVLQILVAALLLLAALDWLLQAPIGAALLKLGFAIALQLGALTAFLAPREQ